MDGEKSLKADEQEDKGKAIQTAEGEMEKMRNICLEEQMGNLISKLFIKMEFDQRVEFEYRMAELEVLLTDKIEEKGEQQEMETLQHINSFKQQLGGMQKAIKDLEEANKNESHVSNLVEEIKKLATGNRSEQNATNGSVTQAQLQASKDLRERRKLLHEEEKDLDRRADLALDNLLNVLTYFSGFYVYLFSRALTDGKEFWFDVGLVLLMLVNAGFVFLITWFKIQTVNRKLERLQEEHRKIISAAIELNLVPAATSAATTLHATVIDIDESFTSDPTWGSFYRYVHDPLETSGSNRRLHKFLVWSLGVFAICFAVYLIVFLRTRVPASTGGNSTCNGGCSMRETKTYDWAVT